MSRRDAALLAGAALLLAVLAVLASVWWRLAGRDQTPPPDAGLPAVAAGPAEMIAGELFFPDANGRLQTQSHELPVTASGAERTVLIAQALLDGPREDGLYAPLREGVTLEGVHLSAAGIVYLDLGSPELAAPPVAGSRSEILAVYSFVNSILANVPEAQGVVLLWNGKQRSTFAGHIDTSRPLASERRWLARR